MADSYIDQYERPLYGQICVRRIRSWVQRAELEGDEAAVARFAADLVEEATGPLPALLGDRADVTLEFRGAHDAKQPLIERVRAKLEGFASKLGELESEGATIDRASFHVPTAMGRATRNLMGLCTTLIAARRLCECYADKHPALAGYAAELAQLADALDHQLDHAANSEREVVVLTPQLRLACDAWDLAYASAKHIMRGLLGSRGELGRMRYFFHDLAVPSTSRLSSDPGEPPEA